MDRDSIRRIISGLEYSCTVIINMIIDSANNGHSHSFICKLPDDIISLYTPENILMIEYPNGNPSRIVYISIDKIISIEVIASE